MLTWQALAIEIILGLRPRIISMAKACQVNIFQCLPPVDRPLTQCPTDSREPQKTNSPMSTAKESTFYGVYLIV